jgi:hypothetical protein
MVVVVVFLLLVLFISLVRYFYIFGLRHVDESKFGTPTWEGFQSLHTKISAVSAVVFRRVLLLALTHIHIQRGLAKHHRFFSISALIPPIFKAFLDL